jgi:hypothetical protein
MSLFLVIFALLGISSAAPQFGTDPGSSLAMGAIGNAAAGTAGQPSWASSAGLGAQNLANAGQAQNINNAMGSQMATQMGAMGGMGQGAGYGYQPGYGGMAPGGYGQGAYGGPGMGWGGPGPMGYYGGTRFYYFPWVGGFVNQIFYGIQNMLANMLYAGR